MRLRPGRSAVNMLWDFSCHSFWMISSHDASCDAAMHVRQAKIAAAIAIREMFMIEAEQRQQSGMKIVNVNLILRCVVAVIVSRAVSEAGSYAAAGHPHGKAFGIMIA